MKIIFLDIDGVLNCDRYIIENNCRGIGIDPTRMVLLADIVRASGAKIVLTTSWRAHWSEKPEECDAMGREINEAFAAHGLSVYSKTPRISYNREEEILAWLDENPEATRFVIIGVHVGGGALAAAPDVARADHHADLHTQVVHFADDLRSFANFVEIKQIGAGLQRLAGELEHYTLVNGHEKDLLTYLCTK